MDNFIILVVGASRTISDSVERLQIAQNLRPRVYSVSHGTWELAGYSAGFSQCALCFVITCNILKYTPGRSAPR